MTIHVYVHLMFPLYYHLLVLSYLECVKPDFVDQQLGMETFSVPLLRASG